MDSYTNSSPMPLRNMMKASQIDVFLKKKITQAILGCLSGLL